MVQMAVTKKNGLSKGKNLCAVQRFDFETKIVVMHGNELLMENKKGRE